MACISAETGTLAFAIINLIIVAGSSLFSIGLLIFWGVVSFYDYDNKPWNHSEIDMGVSQLFAILGMMFMSFICLLFSSFLMNGILKKNPAHLKVYFIYGVLKMVLMMSVLLTMISIHAIDIYAFFVILGVHFIYSLILYMIRYTYVKYEMINDQFSHTRLVEKC